MGKYLYRKYEKWKKDGIGTIRIFTGKFEYHYYYQGKKYRGPLYRFPIYEEKKVSGKKINLLSIFI